MFHIQFETPGPPIPIASRQMDALIKRRALLRDRANLQPHHQQNRRGRQQPEVSFEKLLQVVIVPGSGRAVVLPENLWEKPARIYASPVAAAKSPGPSRPRAPAFRLSTVRRGRIPETIL